MSKRLTDTEKWDKEWFMSLPPKLKCAVQFIRDKCDLTGVWSPNWKLISIYVTEQITKEEVLSIDNGRQFLELENGRIFCYQFIEFQNGFLPDENAQEKISPIIKKILSMLKSNDLIKKSDGYIYPINRVLDRAVVIVEVKEEVIVEEIVKGKVIVNVPTLEIFLNHCKEVLQNKFESYRFSLESKYHTWVDDNWTDGNGKKIINWKNKINNTIPHLKPIKNGKSESENDIDRLHRESLEYLTRNKD